MALVRALGSIYAQRTDHIASPHRAVLTDHPGAGSYLDRHGKRRWRFRRGKKTLQLPHEPGHPEFEAAYMAAVEGREHKPATVHRLPTAASPRSWQAAWRILRSDYVEWRKLGPDARENQTRLAEELLGLVGSADMAEVRRKHVKALVARKADSSPHSARQLLTVIRKLCHVALDQEWIEMDPTYGIKYRPELKGWKAWPDEMLDKFEARWPLGTTPRLVYALALYLGHRRADIVTLRPADIKGTAARVVQQKTGKALELPIHPNLREALDAVPGLDSRPYVVLTYRGNRFSPEVLDAQFRRWRQQADVAEGYSMHGLRKTLGKHLALNDATTRQLMEVLGHDKLEHAELYSREAEQQKLAAAAMAKLLNWRRK